MNSAMARGRLPHPRLNRLWTNRWVDSALRVVPGSVVLPTALYALIAIALWLPFGLRTTGLVEEWDLTWLLDRGEQLWWITSRSALAAFRLRPLTVLPFAVNHALGDGFVWLNVIALAVFVVKGLATFLLVERLAPGHRAAAIVAGALAMLYPANAGLFTFRVIHIQMAVVLFLLSLVLLCDLALSPRVWRFVTMSVLLGASLLMYQIASVATVFAPLLLLARRQGGWLRFGKVSALWFAAPAAVATYWLIVKSQGGTYEFQSTGVAPRPSPGTYGHDLIRSYVDQLFRAWRPASWVSWEPRYVALGAVCGALVALAVLAERGGSARLGTRAGLVGGVVAIVVAPLGFLPIWAITAAIHETVKVYLLSSIAIAIGVSLLLAYLCRRPALVAPVGGLLVGLAAVYGLHQHAHYVSLAHAQSRVLGELVQALPAPRDGTTIVVRDYSGQLSQVWTLGPPVTFAAAVEVAFHNPTLRVVLCDELRRHAYLNGTPIPSCPDGSAAAVSREGIDAADLAIFDYDLLDEMRLVARARGLPATYAPTRLAGAGRPARRSLFRCNRIQACTSAPSAGWPRGSLHETINNSATNVTGLRPAETTPSGTSFRWSDAREIHAYAFLPAEPSQLELTAFYVINPSVIGSIRLKVNGEAVPARAATAGSEYRITAAIPAKTLKASPDDIEITSDVFPVAGSPDPLGLAVARLDVSTTPRER
jgi:hypothetical protein